MRLTRPAVFALLAVAIVVASCTATPSPGLDSTSDEFRVGLLLPGPRNDGNWGQAMFRPLTELGRELHGDAFKLTTVNGQFGETNRRTIERWVDQGYRVIIDHGTAREVSIDESRDAPQVFFAIYGDPVASARAKSPTENVWSYAVDSSDVALVRSALGAAIAGEGSIGLIRPFAGDGFDDEFTDAAQATVGSARVEIRETRSFSNTQAAVLVAEELVRDGAGVLTGTSESMLGAIVVAQRERVPWIGTRIDQAYLAPDIVFASQLERFDLVVERVLVAAGTGGAGHIELGVENGGITVVFNDRFALEGGDRARGIAERALDDIDERFASEGDQ